MRGPLFSIIAFFVFEGLLYAALKFLPAYMHMDTLRELPLAGVYAAIVLGPIIVTVLVFRNRSNAEKVKIAFTMMGFASLIGVTGNFMSQQTRHLTDVMLIFNWVEGAIMLLGGIVCGMLAYIKAPAAGDSSVADSQPRMDSSNATRRKAGGDDSKAEANAATVQSLVETDEKAPAIAPTSTAASRGLKVPLGTGNKMPAMTGQDLKQKNAMSNSASNLRGLLDTLAPDDDVKPEPTALQRLQLRLMLSPKRHLKLQRQQPRKLLISLLRQEKTTSIRASHHRQRLAFLSKEDQRPVPLPPDCRHKSARAPVLSSSYRLFLPVVQAPHVPRRLMLRGLKLVRA
jgi:hypothetical protein